MILPTLVRPASGSVPSPPSLHSLAFLASLGLPTPDPGDLPLVKSKQIKAFKDAPGRYILVEHIISSKRIRENTTPVKYGTSDFSRSHSLLFDEFLMFHKGIWDCQWIPVTRGSNIRVLNIGDQLADHRGWKFTMNGEIDQAASRFTMNGEIDKDGSLYSEFILSQQELRVPQHYRVQFGRVPPNPVQLDVQMKITFEDNKMDINVSGKNEHFEGNFIGQYSKFGEESSPDSNDEESDE